MTTPASENKREKTSWKACAELATVVAVLDADDVDHALEVLGKSTVLKEFTLAIAVLSPAQQVWRLWF